CSYIIFLFYILLLVFFTAPATTPIYPLSLHDALPISISPVARRERAGASTRRAAGCAWSPRSSRTARTSRASPPHDWILARSIADRKSTRLNSSHVEISYAVFCLKKKKKN